MEKRGWMRIVEATVAILIVLGVLFFLFTRSRAPPTVNLDDQARSILEEMALNSSMRKAILENDEPFVNRSARAYVPRYLEYEIRICPTVSDACGKSSYSGLDTYAAERIISSDVQVSQGAKKVRLFIWNAYAA